MILPQNCSLIDFCVVYLFVQQTEPEFDKHFLFLQFIRLSSLFSYTQELMKELRNSEILKEMHNLC